MPQAVAEGIKAYLKKIDNNKKTPTVFSTAHPELGLRGYAVIFQHSKTLPFPKITTYMVSVNIDMYLRGSGYL